MPAAPPPVYLEPCPGCQRYPDERCDYDCDAPFDVARGRAGDLGLDPDGRPVMPVEMQPLF